MYTLTIVNANVTGDLTLIVDGNTNSLTGTTDTIIRGQSDVTAVLSSQTYKGATVTNTTIAAGEAAAYDVPNVIFLDCESARFAWFVRDSRGTTATGSKTLDIIDYIKLTCNLKAKMAVTGEATLNVSGNVFNDTFGAVANTLALQYRYKESYGEWTDWIDFPAAISDNTYSATVTVNGLDYRVAYIFQTRAIDKLITIESLEQNAVALPTFDWSGEDFNFNVPVVIKGDLVPSLVEQGTDYDWTYRKWSDGTLECWAKKDFTVDVASAWGSMFTSGAIPESNLSFPEGWFIETPNILVSLQVRSTGGLLMAPGGVGSNTANATQTGVYEIARGTSLNNGAFTINYQVKGRWK
jgi:hypothetical protein